MKNKNALIVTASSLCACVLHAILLHTRFNHYAYTSMLKVALFILCPAVYFSVSKDGKLKDMFFPGKDKGSTKSYFILGFIVFLFIFIAFAVVNPLLDQSAIVEGLSKTGITGDNFLFVFIYIVLINAALEETFFRGFVFLTLYRMNYKKYAYVYSSMLFAFYHVFILNNWVSPGILVLAIVGLAVSGLVFGELARRFNSVFGSLIVHAGANIAINLIGVYYLYLYPNIVKVS